MVSTPRKSPVNPLNGKQNDIFWYYVAAAVFGAIILGFLYFKVIARPKVTSPEQVLAQQALKDFDISRCGTSDVICAFQQSNKPYDVITTALQNIGQDQSKLYRVFYEIRLAGENQAIQIQQQSLKQGSTNNLKAAEKGRLHCNGEEQYFYVCQEFTTNNPRGVILPLMSGYSGLQSTAPFDVKVMVITEDMPEKYRVAQQQAAQQQQAQDAQQLQDANNALNAGQSSQQQSSIQPQGNSAPLTNAIPNQPINGPQAAQQHTTAQLEQPTSAIPPGAQSAQSQQQSKIVAPPQSTLETH